LGTIAIHLFIIFAITGRHKESIHTIYIKVFQYRKGYKNIGEDGGCYCQSL